MKILCGRAIKKPVEIHFFKYKGWNAVTIAELKSWIESFGATFWDVIETNSQGKLKIKTLEGSSYDLPDGYVIIRGVEGEFYPCEPNIFDKTYDICTK